MKKMFPGFDVPTSQASDTLKVLKDVSLVVGTAFFGYLSNILVNALDPHFFNSLWGTVVLALTVPLLIALLYKQQRASPWSGLLIGFVVGIFQNAHVNWFESHTDENTFKIALILLALLLLLVPPVIRLINQQNILEGGLLRSLVTALIGWAFWTGSFALFYDVIHAKFFKASVTHLSPLVSWLLGLLILSIYLLIPIMTGSIITYCSGFSPDNYDESKNSWTCLIALFGCWFGLCWSFWKLDWFHVHLIASPYTIPPDAEKIIFAVGGWMFMAIGLACAWYEFGPVAWIHSIWEGCTSFFQEMFGTD